MNAVERNIRRRRSFALIVTLMLVVLLAATVSQLATTTSVESIRIARGANRLAHELAVDSVIRVAGLTLKYDPAVTEELDRAGCYLLAITLGECEARCRVTDDGAKLDVAAFADQGREHLLRHKLQAVQRRFDLADARVQLQPVPIDALSGGKRYVWFDQLVDAPDPGAIFPPSSADAPLAWSDLATCFGSGQVDVRRASREILEILLSDIDRTLAGRVVKARRRKATNRLDDVLKAADADVRGEAESRLAYGLDRYSLLIETTVGGDRRRWYVVAPLTGDTLNVHYRGRILW